MANPLMAFFAFFVPCRKIAWYFARLVATLVILIFCKINFLIFYIVVVVEHTSGHFAVTIKIMIAPDEEGYNKKVKDLNIIEVLVELRLIQIGTCTQTQSVKCLSIFNSRC